MTERPHDIGDLIGGRFVLVEPLGRGSFGAVWRAADCENGALPCALKILFDAHRGDPKKLQRFVQEGKILARLDHPNIAKMIAAAHEGDEAYVAMELIDGEPLHTKLETHAREGRPIPLEGIAWLTDQLAAAIGYAHAQHVVHRDLKPRNIMVNRRGQRPFLKVLDFGIAKVMVGSEVDPTTVGRMLGSLMYVAPEQLRGEAIDHRADVFALSTMVFEMLTLHRTWARDEAGLPIRWRSGIGDPVINSHVGIAKRIAREPRPRASSVRADLSDTIDEVLMRGLAIDPADRYPHVDAFAAALRGALTEAKHGITRARDIESTLDE